MIRRLLFFFPSQLLFIHLKKNHVLLIFWIILFGIVNQSIASKYGIPYLFLVPEYLSTISFWSYLIMGFSIGGFVMAFNTTSYVMNSRNFPFIAALKRPFLRYSINNSLFPLLFVIYYMYNVVIFHLENENSSVFDIFTYVSGFIIGYVSFVSLSLTYFLTTNKNIFKILGITPSTDNKTPINSLFLREEKWYRFFRNTKSWHVESYLYTPFRSKLARDISHYDKDMLKSVLNQNHINASLFEAIIFSSLIVLGLFQENALFVIPAGASITLFFTLILILFSSGHTWFRGWSTLFFVGLFILINFLSKQQVFTYTNMAYGLNYNTTSAEYSLEKINSLRSNEVNLNNDVKTFTNILNNWKKKNAPIKKPKMVFINTSGGGSRSMLWTFYVLQHADSLLNGQLLKQTHLITGSSGGMIGAAYLRELYLQQQNGNINSIYNKEYQKDMTKDLLNPIAFSIATNDFFIRLRKYNDGKYVYTKDRAYAFERQLHINTNQLMNKRIRDYATPEFQSDIPIMIFSPTVINDGRRMLISSQPISFLSNNLPYKKTTSNSIVENFEFRRMFKDQDADNLQFSSAIRMSSTFPYIMPSVSLPSEPQINVIDAGMRDNYGSTTTFRYIYTFKEWITKNTSGVIIIQLRDKPKELEIKPNPLKTITESFSSPVGSLFENLFPIQDYNLDDMLQYLSADFDHPIDVINFELDNPDNKISLSWHLTTREKERILNSINLNSNQKSLERLQELMK